MGGSRALGGAARLKRRRPPGAKTRGSGNKGRTGASSPRQAGVRGREGRGRGAWGRRVAAHGPEQSPWRGRQSALPVQRHPGAGGARSLAACEGTPGGPGYRSGSDSASAPSPPSRRVAGPTPAGGWYLGRSALLRSRRLRQIPRGCGRKRRPRARQAPWEHRRLREGPARAEGPADAAKERTVPARRNLRPARRWAGRAEPPPRR